MLAKRFAGLRVNGAAFKPSVRALSSTPYSEKQEKLGRPLSPHVTIYKFPLAATTSILNRGTGVALSVGVAGVGLISLFGGNPADVFQCIGDSAVGPLAKLAVSYPLVYHFLGGLRHFYWDASPETLTSEQVEKTSQILLGSSVFLTLIVAFL